MNIFIHSFVPPSVAFSIVAFHIYYYGVVMALAILGALVLSLSLGKKRDLDTETLFDLASWLIIGGLVGARIYEIFLEFPYYSTHPSEIIKIWHGGLAIHGALIGGLITLLIFIKKKKINFWNTIAVLLPGVALGQAIGRWGNWFNQELFGRPTNAPWGIPINLINRPSGYELFKYFQPTFLYESLSLIVLTIILYYFAKAKNFSGKKIAAIYLIGYGLIRFLLEFIKIDPTPLFLGLRFPQIISLIMILLGGFLWFKTSKS